MGVVICTMFMLLRLYSRRFVTRIQAWSDGIIVVVVILGMVSAALTNIAISYGLGRYTILVPLENVSPAFYGAIFWPISIVSVD
jgi:hypothetical protein